jgi:hypothetical protein
MSESWVNLSDGVPPPLRFATTGGNGAALVIDTQTDAAYYKKQGGPVTPLLGNGNVVAAVGGMRRSTPIAIPDLGAGYFQVKPFEVLTYAVPKYVSLNLADGTLAVERVSDYQITFDINLQFDVLNAGRNLFLRLWNIDSATPGVTTELFVGRNTEGLAEFLIFGVSATEAILGDRYVMEIGGGDAFTNVTLRGARYEVCGVGT